MNQTEVLVMLGKIFVFFFCLALPFAGYLTLAERKVAAWIQNRYGPNRVGPWGLFQPLADGLKFLFKEEVIPDNANPVLFRMAPAMAAAPVFMTLAVVPFTFPVIIDQTSYSMAIADIPIGMLFFLAMGSLSVYGILFAGWASNNKYSLLGGIRSSAQMLSYELVMILSVIAVICLSGTMSLTEIFLGQPDTPGSSVVGQMELWHVFRFPVGTIAFAVFLIAAFAETNRHPFDLAECETELVGGFHTEYSSMRFALFFMGEYTALFTMSAMITLLFCGGPSFFGLVEGIEGSWIRAVVGFLVFFAKMFCFLFLFLWVRWTMPRFRWDQLMKFGWKILLPIAIVNVALAGIVVVYQSS